MHAFMQACVANRLATAQDVPYAIVPLFRLYCTFYASTVCADLVLSGLDRSLKTIR